MNDTFILRSRDLDFTKRVPLKTYEGHNISFISLPNFHVETVITVLQKSSWPWEVWGSETHINLTQISQRQWLTALFAQCYKHTAESYKSYYVLFILSFVLFVVWWLNIAFIISKLGWFNTHTRKENKNKKQKKEPYSIGMFSNVWHKDIKWHAKLHFNHPLRVLLSSFFLSLYFPTFPRGFSFIFLLVSLSFFF